MRDRSSATSQGSLMHRLFRDPCNSWYRALAIALTISMLAAPTLAATPIVIHNGGPTVPISQYLSSFFEGNRNQSPSDGNNTVSPAQPPVPMTFPIVTPSMAPGKIPAPFRLNLKGWLTGPVFFIGADPLSRDWLTQNRDRLTSAKASGVVVNVASFSEFRALQAQAPMLPMAPSSVESLASQLNLRIYPVIITVDGLVTQ